MKAWQLIKLLGLTASLATGASAQTVSLDHEDALVWLPDQLISGRLEQTGAAGTLFVDTAVYPFAADAGRFSVPVVLGDGPHALVACAEAAGTRVCSDTLRLELGYELHPEVFAFAEAAGTSSLTLKASVLDNPSGSELSFEWSADPENPAGATITSPTDTVTEVSLDDGAALGEYYFDLVAVDSTGAVGRARTFVTNTETGIVPFDLWTDHAAWVDSAVIYEVTPYNFVGHGTLSDVLARLTELREFGINTLWIQPVFETGYGGQGYDVTNYFKLRPDYGTEETIHEIVDRAHGMGMRVMLDFVPNHTSILHPYAQDAIAHGTRSHYFNFYQRELDDVMYSRHYHQRTDGKMVFTYYFWTDLVNINYNNPEVQRWMIEAGLRWVEDFDIDGYRIDAVWGTNARTPEAMQNWRFALKRAKPEVFLLGEDKATRPESFDRRFDAAYDWYPEESWVSHWTWQYNFSTTDNPTLFNVSNQRVRASMLRESITNRGQGFHPDAKVLRFMENNDTFRFHATHAPLPLERTKLAATILFTLHGIPLVYNGQEIGYPRHPYSTFQVFNPNEAIADQDPYGLYPYYRQLIDLRTEFPALYSDNYMELPVDPRTIVDYVFAYHRWHDDSTVAGKRSGGDDLFVIANLGASSVTAAVTVPDRISLDPEETYYVTDLLTGEYWSARGSALVRVVAGVPAYTARVLALGEAPVVVGTTGDALPSAIAGRLVLEQNYPNPFSDRTVLPLSIPQSGRVRLTVYDLLGRPVRTLVDGPFPAGYHAVSLDAHDLPVGMYVATLESDSGTVSRKISVVR
jgi:glycosidase